jgi:hypothetical protein
MHGKHNVKFKNLIIIISGYVTYKWGLAFNYIAVHKVNTMNGLNERITKTARNEWTGSQ